MYGSVLQGFSRQKRFDRVWAMYREMLPERIGFTIAAFNALIDACARNCESARIPFLLEEMWLSEVAITRLLTCSAVRVGSSALALRGCIPPTRQ